MNKDLEWFEDFYHTTYHKLSKHVFYRTKNATDTQDLLQEIYLSFFIAINKQSSPITFRLAYLYKIADHVIATYFKNKAHNPISLTTEDDLFATIPDDFELEVQVFNDISVNLIWQQIETIKEPERSLLIARFKYDLSYKEIASMFELAETTVKSKIYKQITELKKIFNK